MPDEELADLEAIVGYEKRREEAELTKRLAGWEGESGPTAAMPSGAIEESDRKEILS